MTTVEMEETQLNKANQLPSEKSLLSVGFLQSCLHPVRGGVSILGRIWRGRAQTDVPMPSPRSPCRRHTAIKSTSTSTVKICSFSSSIIPLQHHRHLYFRIGPSRPCEGTSLVRPFILLRLDDPPFAPLYDYLASGETARRPSCRVSPRRSVSSLPIARCCL